MKRTFIQRFGNHNELKDLLNEGWVIESSWKLREDLYGKGAIYFILEK